MGYNTERFMEPVDANLICGICSGVLEAPVLTPCGHSYCAHCLTTWLSREGANTCPECRSFVDDDSPKPILSLRNLIQAMEARCVNASRGCDTVTSLEKQDSHVLSCKFVSVACAGCQTEVKLSELAGHQMSCSAIRNALEADDNEYTAENTRILSRQTFCTLNQNRSRMPSTNLSAASYLRSQEPHVMRLLTRISSLEKQVVRLMEDIKESNVRNTLLYLQYRKVQDELEDQIRFNSLQSVYLNERDYKFDSSEYNVSHQRDIAKLSLLIARYLLDKPRHIDSNRVFTAVRNSYVSHFSELMVERHHDIHMLLATAYASNWFPPDQKVELERWLQCVLQCQGCRRLVEG